MKIRREDMVIVISGKDRGKTGKVTRVDPDKDRVYVEGLNMMKRHTKPRPPSSTDRAARGQSGGILEIAQPLSLSKVMIVCPECKEPTRIGHEKLASGERVRTCKRRHRLEVKG